MVLLSMFEGIIERGRKRGVFKTSDSRLAAHNIIVLCDMWAFRRWDLGRRYVSDQYIKKQIAFILHGLSNEDTESGSKKTKEVKRG